MVQFYIKIVFNHFLEIFGSENTFKPIFFLLLLYIYISDVNVVVDFK